MNTTSPLCHEALLTLARKLEGAASDGDRGCVESEARRLLDALIDHIRSEETAIARLSAEMARGLSVGQERLVDDLIELATDVHERDLPRYDRLAQQLIAELTVQADDERRSGLSIAIP